MTLTPEQYQTTRLELLSRLAGDISHEIKNPLHAMVINLELVRRKVEKGEDDQAIERVAIVEDEIRKVHALANALLEALRPPRDASGECGFAAVLQELRPLMTARARLARVELNVEARPTPAAVPLPAHELRLLLLDLADRAVRAAGDGGSVSIDARSSGESLVIDVDASAPLADDAEQAWLDRPAEDADHIDLGLRVVRDLVDRAGGRITTGTVAGGGHRLTITLPSGASA